MTDPKADAKKCLESPTTTEEISTSCDNSSAINPNASILPSGNDRQSSGNDAANKTQEEEALHQAVTKKKIKKPKKKSDPTKGPSSNKESAGEAASSIHLASSDQPPVPIYCKKCLGTNVGKKGERSDAYVITCSKCGSHEVLLKPDGTGVVKLNEPGSENLPQGDLQDAAMKNARDKLFSALKLKDQEYPIVDEQMSSRISVFSQHLQYCSRECADLYPLIITLRSLQLKKTSSTPQQRKTIENEIKSRLGCLEEGILGIETFAAKFLKQSPGASHHPGEHSTDVGKKKKSPSAQSSASAGATSAEPKESTSQACSSLFDPLSPTATSPSGAVCSPPSEENNAASSKVTGGASAAAASAGVSNPAATASSSKTKPSLWYIERVEQLNSRLEIMHAHLGRYIMIQSAVIQNKAEEAIAKVQRNGAEGQRFLENFTQGMVDHCKSMGQESRQKMEMKRKQIKDKQRLLTEASLLAQHCRATGDEEGLRKIEDLLRQINFQN